MERAARIGLNEATFREVNESIDKLQRGFGATKTIDIVCECGSAECMERLTITQDAYARIRSDATLFALVPGHDMPDVESVVEEGDGYVVVKKHEGTPARVARETATAD
jgi:hypothetical protein